MSGIGIEIMDEVRWGLKSWNKLRCGLKSWEMLIVLERREVTEIVGSQAKSDESTCRIMNSSIDIEGEEWYVGLRETRSWNLKGEFE
jgi:hypothetical protein